MKNTHKNNEWDSRKLGTSEKHVRKVALKQDKATDDKLGLQIISIRLQKSLINDLKKLAEENGIGYQPFIRQLLTRYVRESHREQREKSKLRKQAFLR